MDLPPVIPGLVCSVERNKVDPLSPPQLDRVQPELGTGLMVRLSLTSRLSDIYQDGSQVLFKACPGTQGMPCERTVHMGQSEDPRCPIHLILPPPMFQPEQEAPLPETLGATSRDMYLSAAELQPTENLPLEFSDVRTPPTPPPGAGSSRRFPGLLRRSDLPCLGFIVLDLSSGSGLPSLDKAAEGHALESAATSSVRAVTWTSC